MWCAAYLDGLVQERRNSIANALEFRLSCTNQSIYNQHWKCASPGHAFMLKLNGCGPGEHFIIDLSFAIQIPWKFHFVFISMSISMKCTMKYMLYDTQYNVIGIITDNVILWIFINHQYNHIQCELSSMASIELMRPEMFTKIICPLYLSPSKKKRSNRSLNQSEIYRADWDDWSKPKSSEWNSPNCHKIIIFNTILSFIFIVKHQ